MTIVMKNAAALILLLIAALSASAQTSTGEKLLNSGFEGGGGSNGRGGGVPHWEAFDSGYDVDRQNHHSGEQSIRCDSLRTTITRGALNVIELNQASPTPIVVIGWSRADSVGGIKDGDYSLYVDLEYNDGTSLYGQLSPFTVGTHDWERKQVLIIPQKPVKTLRVYALFRKHTGTVWFDDFSVRQLDGVGSFDSQPLLPIPSRSLDNTPIAPIRVKGGDGLSVGFNHQGDIVSLHASAAGGKGEDEIGPSGAGSYGGFYLRDVAKDGKLIPVHGATKVYHGNGVTLSATPKDTRISFYAKITPEGDALAVDGEITDVSKLDRALTVYLAIPIKAIGWQWGQDIRHSRLIEASQEYTNQTHVNVGATGGLSLYPFAAVTGEKHGVEIANEMEWPSIYRIFYNGPTKQLVIAWDFALTTKTAAWPSSNARFRCKLFNLSISGNSPIFSRLSGNEGAQGTSGIGLGAWGFRAAAKRLYQLNRQDFDRRSKAEGIWMPFTAPNTINHPEDFNFAYHEGDNSLKADDAASILSFRYTEPMTWWMSMKPEIPRTYENAIVQLQKWAVDPKNAPSKEMSDMARAVLYSGTMDEKGRYNLEFRNEPWGNGAVFVLNPNPELPATDAKPTKAFLSYTSAKAKEMYGAEAKLKRGEQDGEYLDSLEGWSDYQDYRPSHLQASPYPVTFDLDTRLPVIPQWFSTHAFTRFLRDDLHNRGKLLMANSTPIRFSALSTLLDVSGIEVNWIDFNGKWNPDSDEVFNLRRTMSGQKPYLLLMNTNFDKFTLDLVEKYFQRSMFYGVYPSMFSADAATNPYWESPKWYNRDRNLFKKYIPIIKQLSSAGWEPMTYAVTNNPAVYAERYGSRHFTVLNDSIKSVNSDLIIDLSALNIPKAGLHVINMMTGAEIAAESRGNILSISLAFLPEESIALELR